MPQAKPHGVPGRDCFAAPVSATPRAQQIESIATGDWPSPRRIPDSFWFLLSGELQESLLRLAHIVEGERTRFNQVGHDGSAPASEQAQEVVNKSALCGFTGHSSLENECRGNLLCAAQCFLDFQAVDRRLDGGVGGPLPGRKRFLNLPDRTRSASP